MKDLSNWECRVEVIDPIQQQLRIITSAGEELKVWRDGDRFALAVRGRVEGRYPANEILPAINRWARQ